MQRKCSCPLCHWLLAAAVMSGLAHINFHERDREMYHQDLEQEHFPPPFILTSEATLTDLIFYATFFFDVKGLLSAESNIAIDAA